MKAWIWLTALVALAVGAWLLLRPKHAPTPAQPLTILLTCDVHGRLVPCGCFTGQLGGLTRIASLFGPAAADQIRVDAGDALAGSADYERIQYGYIQKAFAAIVPDDADVSKVADAIVDLVGAPFGTRPFRVHIDPSQDGADVGFTVMDRLLSYLRPVILVGTILVLCLAIYAVSVALTKR